MALLQMDDPSLELIIRLQLEDADSLVENGHVKGGKNDDTVIFQIYRSELRALEADRRLCEILARGEEPGNRDDNVPADNQPAQGVQGQRQSDPDPDPHHATTAEAEDDEEEDIYSAPVEEPSVKDASPNETHDARHTDELSSNVSKPSQESPVQGIETPECVACREVYRHSLIPGLGFAHCPCDHWYCSDCLSALFTHSLTDESLFPPRCCTMAIPVDDFQEFLTPAVVTQFHEKAVEYNTLDRTYCHQLECSAFIPAPMQEQTASCPACSESTCTSCKGPAHDGKDCPEDPASKELLQLARERGWQRCFSCHRMVELNTGCNHITCRCGGEFCYLCGERWKNCPCEHVTERHLWARAVAIVDRDLAAGQRGQTAGVDEAGRRTAIQREMRNQRQNHECTRHLWCRRSGSYECEQCGDTLDRFIHRCANCHTLACTRCRDNRARA